MSALNESEKLKLHRLISNRLSEIERDFFKPDIFEITFLARNKSNPKAHILVTSEDSTARISEAISQIMDQPDASVFPPT